KGLRLLEPAYRCDPMLECLPALVLDGHLAAQPALPPYRDAGLVEGELPRPGREAAVTAKVVETPEDREERVVCRLGRELLEPVGPEAVELRPPRAERVARGPQQQRMELRERPVAVGALAAQALEPGARLGLAVERLVHCRGGEPGGRVSCHRSA